MIPSGVIYGKTAAGADEVKNRKIKMPPKLRTMLILVDGAKPMMLLREDAAALGVDADFIEKLEGLGLVERIGTVAAATSAGAAPPAQVSAKALAGMDKLARFRLAQQFMNDTAVNALGIKAFFFTLKLERCATVEDLRELIDAYRQAIAKASGPGEAEVLSRRVAELLA